MKSLKFSEALGRNSTIDRFARTINIRTFPTMTDIAIPILPCRSLEETLAFYERLGFSSSFQQETPATYAIVCRGTLELHFFGMPELEPSYSYAGCYLRVVDVDGLYNDLSRAGLPEWGIPRMGRVEDRPWGMREFAIVDPNGSLLRIGQVLSETSA